MELGKIPAWHPFIIALQRGEDFACRHADCIISNLAKADLHLSRRGMAAHKFAYVPNGIDIAEWHGKITPLPSEHASALAERRNRGHFIVGYAGGHNVSHALHTLVQTAPLLHHVPISFLLVGDGTEKERLRQQAQQMRLENLVFLPSVAKLVVPAFLAATDALYLSSPRNPLYRFGISPTKLLDYMMAAKPVLHSVDAGNDLVADSGCGISCPPEDSAALAEAVLRLHTMSVAEREAIGLRGLTYVKQHHDYRVLANRFLEAL